MFPENAPRVPLTDSKGYMAREWWRFFGEMYIANSALEARLLDLDGAILALTAREQYYESISTEEPYAPHSTIPDDDLSSVMAIAERALELAGEAYNSFPIGGIAIWSGAVADIPTGWQICDGTNGTPDLTGRFVIHADADSGGTYNVGDTGGSASATTTGPSATTAAAGAGTAGSATHTHDVDTLPPYYALAFIQRLE